MITLECIFVHSIRKEIKISNSLYKYIGIYFNIIIIIENESLGTKITLRVTKAMNETYVLK